MPYFRSYSFSDLLRVTNKDNNSFEHVNIDNHDIILLKGNFALERLNACLHHYDKGTQKGSPLDTIFLIYGPTVSSLSQIHESYELCQRLLSRRFFCGENQHVLSYEELPAENSASASLDAEKTRHYSALLTDYIKTCNQRRISEVLEDLRQFLFNVISFFIICHLFPPIFLIPIYYDNSEQFYNILRLMQIFYIKFYRYLTVNIASW